MIHFYVTALNMLSLISCNSCATIIMTTTSIANINKWLSPQLLKKKRKKL